MKRIILSIALFICFGGFVINAQQLKEAVIAVGCQPVNEKNFDFNTIGTDELSNWKKETFKTQSQNTFAAKCRTKDGLRYTFWFEEETYADETDAQTRGSRTRELPPQLQKEFDDCDGKTLSEYRFRESFRRGDKIYIVSAKPFKLALDNSISPLMKKIEGKIK